MLPNVNQKLNPKLKELVICAEICDRLGLCADQDGHSPRSIRENDNLLQFNHVGIRENCNASWNEGLPEKKLNVSPVESGTLQPTYRG